MYRLTVLYPPPADPAAFRAYYEANHLPLVARLPGLRRSQYAMGLQGLGAESPYFCIFQADFDDKAAMQAALRSPEGAAVADDVRNYATGGATILHAPVQDGPA